MVKLRQLVCVFLMPPTLIFSIYSMNCVLACLNFSRCFSLQHFTLIFIWKASTYLFKCNEYMQNFKTFCLLKIKMLSAFEQIYINVHRSYLFTIYFKTRRCGLFLCYFLFIDYIILSGISLNVLPILFGLLFIIRI